MKRGRSGYGHAPLALYPVTKTPHAESPDDMVAPYKVIQLVLFCVMVIALQQARRSAHVPEIAASKPGILPSKPGNPPVPPDVPPVPPDVPPVPPPDVPPVPPPDVPPVPPPDEPPVPLLPQAGIAVRQVVNWSQLVSTLSTHAW